MTSTFSQGYWTPGALILLEMVIQNQFYMDHYGGKRPGLTGSDWTCTDRLYTSKSLIGTGAMSITLTTCLYRGRTIILQSQRPHDLQKRVNLCSDLNPMLLLDSLTSAGCGQLQDRGKSMAQIANSIGGPHWKTSFRLTARPTGSPDLPRWLRTRVRSAVRRCGRRVSAATGSAPRSPLDT